MENLDAVKYKQFALHFLRIDVPFNMDLVNKLAGFHFNLSCKDIKNFDNAPRC
jgi:hypothetical protein